MQALIQSSESDLDLFLLDVCECDRVECLESTLPKKKKNCQQCLSITRYIKFDGQSNGWT